MANAQGDLFCIFPPFRLFSSSEGVESNPGPQSIRETLNWYRETLQNGKCSEAKIKSESLTFFDLSSANQMKDKKLFKKSLEGLVKARTKTQKNILIDQFTNLLQAL